MDFSWICLILLLFLQSFLQNFGSMPVFAINTHMFRPLRIYPYYHKLNYELNDDEAQLLKDTVNNVILYVRKFLSVIPVNGNLLLKRNACKSSWTSGRNKEKCASIKKDYAGEFCMEEFKIPDEHLEAFYTWTNQPLPERTWYSDGNGVKNADFVLYVQAVTTKSCLTNFSPELSENVLIAYASYCKLGYNDRPIAGYINFCRTEFVKYKHDRNKLILYTLHEIFHVLGFSKDLFLDYRDARQFSPHDSFEIPRYSFPILHDYNGTFQLSTPTLVSIMENHFGCVKNDWNMFKGAPLISSKGVLQSHFNSKIFPGSIMTPKLDQPEYTFVDPMTLAVFQDTGWYTVNFSIGDDYFWGKDKGCSFLNKLIAGECHHCNEHQEVLCHKTFNSGCNYLQTEIIDCENHDLFTTSVAEGKSVQDCRFNSSGTSYYASTVKGDFGRCVLYEEDYKVTGRCITVRCSVGIVWIKLRDSDLNWMKCLPGDVVKDVETGGFVVCPLDQDVFCYRRKLPVYLQDLITLEATTVTERPRATYRVTQSNMYSVEQITDGRSVNIGWFLHNCSLNIADIRFWLLVCLIIIPL